MPPRIFIAAILWTLLIPGSIAAPLRVATFNVRLGLDEPGSTGHEAAVDVLSRIDADVVALQEVYIADFTSGSFAAFADSLGYSHRFLASGALDPQTRVALLSKYPFFSSSTKSIVSPTGANDVTRAAAAARIDVPGTDNDPYIITSHLKCCASRNSDSFRRAVEMIRVRNYLNDLGLNGEDNVFYLGDFNLIPNDRIFTSLPSDVPATFVLGNDISFNVPYFTDPTSYFTAEGLVNTGHFQQDGSNPDTFAGGGVLDHLLISEAIASRNPATEIFNAALDSTFPGLPKSGSPLTATTGSNASDHYVVFGDYELDDGIPLQISVNPSTLSESSSPATITVTLPGPQTDTVEVQLTSTDPSEASPTPSTLSFAPGETSKTSELIPQTDNLLDGTQTLDLMASSSGFDTASLSITITDSDLPAYQLELFDIPLVESFDGFLGLEPPAQWVTTGLGWTGFDDGSSTAPGGRSYGGNSLGFLATSQVNLAAQFVNQTGFPITSLRVGYLASQWRSSFNGSRDGLNISFVSQGEQRSLPNLAFLTTISEPTGALTPPLETPKQTYLRGVNIAPGASFSLIFNSTSESNGPTPSSDVFINEFHYDNQGSDQGEFIEVVVGGAFAGSLSDIQIQLYNGNTGSSYGPLHPLTTFTEGTSSPSGHRFFFKDIAGIQNGSPDGIALIVEGSVKDFLSYEGTFTAVGGPADGMRSSNIGVSQNGATPAGLRSLSLVGSGRDGSDFTWSSPPGNFTKGAINTGQTFDAASSPQGIGIDDLTLIALSDRDGDLISDEEERLLGTNPLKPDTDGDGQSDFFEAILAETDPLSGSSFLKTTTLVDNSGVVTVSVPTLENRAYIIESTADLENWVQSPQYEGTGETLTLVFPETGAMFFRVRIIAP